MKALLGFTALFFVLLVLLFIVQTVLEMLDRRKHVHSFRKLDTFNCRVTTAMCECGMHDIACDPGPWVRGHRLPAGVVTDASIPNGLVTPRSIPDRLVTDLEIREELARHDRTGIPPLYRRVRDPYHIERTAEQKGYSDRFLDDTPC